MDMNTARFRKNFKTVFQGRYTYPLLLILIFILLVLVLIPSGSVFGSNTDWLSQHVALAETIRDACLDQHTLLPSWIPLGGGSNGYQIAYYGFLRPDILIGCLLPGAPMAVILIFYMLAVYLISVLLCFIWLKGEGVQPVLAFGGSVLFMTAGCLFHMHRQVMFVNHLPFLLLAFLCIRKKRVKWLPLCMCLICLSSFYFSIAAFAAPAWYWYQKEGASFWKTSLIRKFLPSAAAAVCMSAALLLPTALILLEHRAGSCRSSLKLMLELLAPNPVLNNLLFNEYGMGLTFVCLYAILAGLARKKFRRDSILFLLFGVFGIFSWILNGTLYARPKILIPFMPLVILHCVRFFQDSYRQTPAGGERSRSAWPLWPFAVILPVGLLWFSQKQFPWILAEAGILLIFYLFRRSALTRSQISTRLQISAGAAHATSYPRRFLVGTGSFLLLLAAPAGLYLTTSSTEDWVSADQLNSSLTAEQAADTNAGSLSLDSLYHFDSLAEPLARGNELITPDMPRSTMYSSVMNQAYSAFYYDTLQTPIRINNRVALLTSDNPFLFHLLGVRYLETTADNVPAGYHIIRKTASGVIAENEHVLPSAYFTEDLISGEKFRTLSPEEQLDAVTRMTVADEIPADIPDKGSVSGETASKYLKSWEPALTLVSDLPDGLDIRPAEEGYEITAEETCTLELAVTDPVPQNIVLLRFKVKNLTWDPVVIDINKIRNKLSGAFAPYPNRNREFHYQFSTDSEEGVARFSVTFSKGRYLLSDVSWHLYDQKAFEEKQYTPLRPDSSLTADPAAEALSVHSEKDPADRPGHNTAGREFQVLSGTVTAENDGLFATSVPMQNGLRIYVDGKPARTVTVNQAFIGAYLEQGTHQIRITFSPPGKSAGCAVSLAAAAGYAVFLLAAGLKKFHRKDTMTERMPGENDFKL